MCCEIKGVSGHRSADKKASAIRFIAMALLVCILSASVLSGFFIVTHTNHEHDRNGLYGTCAICAHVATAENIRKQLFTTLAVAAIAIAGSFAFASHLDAVSSKPTSATLYKLKVKLNN